MCVCIIVHNNTAQHRTVLIIFRLTLQTITVAHMMSNGGERPLETSIWLNHYDGVRYDMIRYTIFTCVQTLTNSQLNVPH